MKSGSQRSQPAPFGVRVKQRQAFGIARSLLFLFALIGLAVWLGQLNSGTSVSNITPTSALDASFKPIVPTTTFAQDATFFISVKLEAYQPDRPLIARWKYEGQVINETTLSTDEIGDGYAGFSLSHSGGEWPIGKYSVEILSKGQSLGSAAFEVRDMP